MTGFRYVMSVVGLDASKYVKGTHGLLPASDEDGPVFLCSEGSLARDRVAATDVRDLLLELSGVREGARLTRRGVTFVTAGSDRDAPRGSLTRAG